MTCVLVVFVVCIHPKESLYSAPCAYLQEQMQVLQGQFASWGTILTVPLWIAQFPRVNFHFHLWSF